MFIDKMDFAFQIRTLDYRVKFCCIVEVDFIRKVSLRWSIVRFSYPLEPISNISFEFYTLSYVLNKHHYVKVTLYIVHKLLDRGNIYRSNSIGQYIKTN